MALEDDWFKAAAKGDLPSLRRLLPTLLAQGKSIELRSNDRFGNSALLLATCYGKIEVIDFLVREGANPHTFDNYQQNAILLACWCQQTKTVEHLMSQYAVDADIVSRVGLTPLMAAARHGNFDLVKLLCDAGVRIELKTKEGECAKDIAAKVRHTSVSQYLDLRSQQYASRLKITLGLKINTLHQASSKPLAMRMQSQIQKHRHKLFAAEIGPDLLRMHAQSKDAIGQKVVAIIGMSRAGKSTMLAYLLGHQMEDTTAALNHVVFVKTPRAGKIVPGIGHEFKSETYLAQVCPHVTRPIHWLDLPGFDSNLTVTRRKLESMSTQLTLSLAKCVHHTLVVIPYEHFTQSTGKGLRDLLLNLLAVYGAHTRGFITRATIVITHSPLVTKESLDEAEINKTKGNTFAGLSRLLRHFQSFQLALGDKERSADGLTKLDYQQLAECVTSLIDKQTHFIYVNPIDQGETRKQIITIVKGRKVPTDGIISLSFNFIRKDAMYEQIIDVLRLWSRKGLDLIYQIARVQAKWELSENKHSSLMMYVKFFPHLRDESSLKKRHELTLNYSQLWLIFSQWKQRFEVIQSFHRYLSIESEAIINQFVGRYNQICLDITAGRFQQIVQVSREAMQAADSTVSSSSAASLCSSSALVSSSLGF